MTDDRDEAYGEAIYRAWSLGLDPDQVDRDEIEQLLEVLGHPCAAADAEVMCLWDRHQQALRDARDEEDARLKDEEDARLQAEHRATDEAEYARYVAEQMEPPPEEGPEG